MIFKGFKSIILVIICLLFAGCQEENSCDLVNCNNGGVCVEGNCDCPEGFTGQECETEDLCITQNIECLNGGTCNNGLCDCPIGYTGVNCESIDEDNLQMLLDEGIFTPLQLVEQGVSLDRVYGLTFMNGIIFYLDVDDRLPNAEGMVVSMQDLSTGSDGECMNEDLAEIENASYSNTNPGVFQSSGLLGMGFENTNAILENCEGISDGAARQCRDEGPEWFLPSMEAIYLVDQNLNELSLFTDFDYYWTSSEYSAAFFWAINTGQRFDQLGTSSSFVSVRAVREF